MNNVVVVIFLNILQLHFCIVILLPCQTTLKHHFLAHTPHPSDNGGHSTHFPPSGMEGCVQRVPDQNPWKSGHRLSILRAIWQSMGTQYDDDTYTVR